MTGATVRAVDDWRFILLLDSCCPLVERAVESGRGELMVDNLCACTKPEFTSRYFGLYLTNQKTVAVQLEQVRFGEGAVLLNLNRIVRAIAPILETVYLSTHA